MPAASAAPRCAASIPSKIDLQRLLAYVHPVILDACSRRVIGWALERTLGDERQTLVGQVRSSRDLAICSWPDHSRDRATHQVHYGVGIAPQFVSRAIKNLAAGYLISNRIYSFPRHMSNAEAQRAELVLDFGHVALPTRRELAEEVGRFYERHYDSLYRYLILSGSTQEEACDLLQEGFLRLWEHAITRNRIERPRSWLVRVLHNIRIDIKRRAWREVSCETEGALELLVTRGGPSVEIELLRSERHESLKTAIRQLTPLQYQYLLLRAEGLTLREIAELYAVTVQAVADVCARATSRLGRLTNE